MQYFNSPIEISKTIAKYAQAEILWLDTEVADYNTKKPRLSLIQILDDPTDTTGDKVILLDVLDQPSIVADFISQIMINPAIEKIFHNASYDLRYLGNKKAENVTCTLQMARSIPYYILPTPNYKLKTLANILCNQDMDKQEQSSDWGKRPLTQEQIDYAYLDCIYLAQVHQQLLELNKQAYPNPNQENIRLLAAKYKEVEQQYNFLSSEYENLHERLKQAMEAQNIYEILNFKLSISERKTVKVTFQELVQLVIKQNINLDFVVNLTQSLQKDLGNNLEKLAVNVEKSVSLRLTSKNHPDEKEQE
jgi:ribonuclease D